MVLQSEYTQKSVPGRGKAIISGKQFIKLSAVSVLAAKSERAANVRLTSDYYFRKGDIHITAKTGKSHSSY